MTKPRRANDLQAEPPGLEDHSSANCVASMQVHFRQTGVYRADDLNRLLGDPRDAVAITADDRVRVHSLSAK
jgi:hypothetical protein